MRYVVESAATAGNRTISIPYGEPGKQTPNGWEFDLDLGRDRYIILDQMALITSAQDVILKGVSIHMVLLSDEWADPDAEANLVQAHGFFGSVGKLEHFWSLESRAVTSLGFQNGQ